jgi:SAM-dependent methyltransferase
VLDRRLLRALLGLAPHQPATCLWRAVELGHLLRSGVLPRTGRGLDLGCGDGRVAWLLARELGAAWQLVGVDPDALETGLAGQLGLYAALHAVDGARIPEPDGSFDFVLSNSVLEHIPDLAPVLDEVARLLRPGGLLVLTVPIRRIHELLAGPTRLGRLATGARDRAAYLAAVDRRVAHLNLWDEEGWRRAVAARGLEPEHASTYLSPRELRRWEALANLTAGLLGRLGSGRRPIEIQRALGLRRPRPPLWIRWPGRLLGRAAAVGLDGRDDTAPGACLLLTARKGGRPATGPPPDVGGRSVPE